MPILFSYPEKSNPVGADLLFITDSASNNTNTIKISSIQDVIDVVDTFNADAPLVAAGTGAGPYTGAITLSLGTVPVNKGGTNLTSYTQGDLLYAPSGAALQGLSIGTAGQVLKVNSGGTAPEWSSDTDTTYTAGDGLDLTGTVFSTDLKANGGITIDTGELVLQLDDSAINGVLEVSNGGVGLNAYSAGDILYYGAGPQLSALPIGAAGKVLKVNPGGNNPFWGDGVDGSGTANQVPMWSDSDTLTDSIMKQVGSGVSAKLVIGGNPNNGLTFENTGTGIPDVTLLPFNGASGANWDMRLPAPPTAGGQVMSLPSTLGSSPYQLEWTTPTTGTGTQYNIPMFATTTTLGDSLLSQDAGATTITFGTAASGQTLDISGQNKISFKGDSTNSWIAANNANPESLEIHADSYLYLRPDEYVVINGVASAPTNADDSGDMGSVVWDTNYLYIAVADDEWKRVALSTW